MRVCSEIDTVIPIIDKYIFKRAILPRKIARISLQKAYFFVKISKWVRKREGEMGRKVFQTTNIMLLKT